MESVRGLQTHLPDCQTAIIPGAGHFFPLTHPKLFLDKLSRFLESGTEERRRYERLSLSFPVGLKALGMTMLPTMTANVSRNGLLLESSCKVESGLDVEIFADLNSENLPLALKGKVIRIDNDKSQDRYRFGIELSIAAAEHHAWKDFILLRNSGIKAAG